MKRDCMLAVYLLCPALIPKQKTLDELNTNLKEVVELCLDELSDEELAGLPEFVGLQQIMVDQ